MYTKRVWIENLCNSCKKKLLKRLLPPNKPFGNTVHCGREVGYNSRHTTLACSKPEMVTASCMRFSWRYGDTIQLFLKVYPAGFSLLLI